MDTALSEVLVFKLFGTETATGTVAAPPIVITLDIIKHRPLHDFPADKAFPVDTFHLQRMKEAFHAGIVVTTSFGTHATMQIMPLQQRLIVRRTVLPPAICMDNDISRSLTSPECHLQRIAGQLRCHPRRHRPTDDRPRPQVNHHREVQPALVGAKIRDVSCPLLIRATRVKILFEQIFTHRQAMFSVADRAELTGSLCTKSLTSQAGGNGFDVVLRHGRALQDRRA